MVLWRIKQGNSVIMRVFSKDLLMQEAETYYTLTINSTDPVINQSTVTCFLTYNGVSYQTTTATVKAGTVITYTLTDTTHNNQGNPIVMTATVAMDSNKTLTCNVTYSTSEILWTSPNDLISNGTLGSSSFAVYASVENGSNYAFHCFDSDATNYWASNRNADLPLTYIFYSPVAVKISTISFVNQTTGFTGGSFSQSNDNANYTDILPSWTNSVLGNGATWSLDVNASAFYKYGKLIFTSWSSGTYSPRLRSISVTGYIESYTYYWNVV